MKLLKQMVLHSMKCYDEGRLNKKFHPISIYQAIIISAIVIGKPIQNAQQKNQLYSQYYRARMRGDRNKIDKNIATLQIEILKDKYYINEFLEQTKRIDIEDDSKQEFYDNESFGYLSAEE